MMHHITFLGAVQLVLDNLETMRRLNHPLPWEPDAAQTPVVFQTPPSGGGQKTSPSGGGQKTPPSGGGQEITPAECLNESTKWENNDNVCSSTSESVANENTNDSPKTKDNPKTKDSSKSKDSHTSKGSPKSNPVSANNSPTKKTSSPRRGSLKKWEGLERSYVDFVKSIENSTMCRYIILRFNFGINHRCCFKTYMF